MDLHCNFGDVALFFFCCLLLEVLESPCLSSVESVFFVDTFLGTPLLFDTVHIISLTFHTFISFHYYIRYTCELIRKWAYLLTPNLS